MCETVGFGRKILIGNLLDTLLELVRWDWEGTKDTLLVN